jgi:aspartyl-tRNA(Asn)/glutamyl-tRNA(Gln) amidotransferase subunit A
LRTDTKKTDAKAGPTRLTIHELVDAYRAGDTTPTAATEAYLARIAALDEKVGAFLTVTRDQALAQAHAADERYRKGLPRGPLDGAPVAIKDVFCTRGIRTTCGSKILEHFVPPSDATAVARLLDGGAVLLGKLNMDEFAMGSSTENSAFFPTRNPWDLTRVPGGSSGGSAAAVAAGMAAAALGTDTGGSIRQPAAFCGDVGLKPTYGRVSRYGLIAFASSLDQIGPLARDVEDAALVLQVVAGHDPLDSTSVDVPVPDYRAELGRGVEGLRIGIPAEYFIEGLDPEVEAAVRAAIQMLEKLGARSEPVSLPHTEYGVAAYYLIAPAEASSNLARYDGVKYGLSIREPGFGLWDVYERSRGAGFGREVKRRIVLGTYALSSGYYDAYYLKAQKVRTLIKQDFDAVFDKFDAVVGPTSPNVAFPLGAKTQDPLAMYLNDLFTIPTSLAGLPGVSVPAGMVDGLPVGLQIIGKALDESTVLRIAHAFEQSTEWHKLRSPVALMEPSAVSRQPSAREG